MDIDTSAPYRDASCCWREPFATRDFEREADRIISIGRAPLLAWWQRFKGRTFPGSYGDSGCEHTSSVAHSLTEGTRFDPARHNFEGYAAYCKAMNRALDALTAE